MLTGGEVAERLNAAVSKTVMAFQVIQGSNPCLSARTESKSHQVGNQEGALAGAPFLFL